MKYALAIVLLLFSWALPATAQPDVSKVDTAKLALGADIFDLIHAKQDFRTQIMAVAQVVLKSEPVAARNAASMDLDSVGKIANDMRPEMREAYADSYARHFSLSQLKAIKAFYQSSAGQALLTEVPGISKDVMAKIGPQMVSRIHAALAASRSSSGEIK